MNGYATEGSSLLGGNHCYRDSPHPSLQMMNPMHPQAMTHQLQLPTTNLTESDITGLTYLNRDLGSTNNDLCRQIALSNSEHNDLTIAMNPNPGDSTTAGVRLERQTPLSIRMNAGLGVFPLATHRLDSPNSGAASSISAVKSAGFPNANSLERNGGQFWTPRPTNHTNMPVLYRQSSFGQTTPNGTLLHDQTINYGPLGATGFTPIHTLTNGRLRTPQMTSSFYADGSNTSRTGSYGHGK